MPSSNLAEIPGGRHLRSGSLNVPSHNGHATNGIMNSMTGNHRFDGPRSPPNTSHVPCKFFRQGACQAGNACPFSHDLSNAAENVCKYFAKGNCKFGPKCANIHVLPDGRRINYSKNGVTIGAAPISLGSRVSPNTYHQHPSNSALTSSFMRADAVPSNSSIPPSVAGGGSVYGATSPYLAGSGADDRYGLMQLNQHQHQQHQHQHQHPHQHQHQLHHHNHHHLGRQPSLENGLPTIDTTYSSNPTSVYGSPRDDESTRLGLGLSPVNVKGLSVLDAPLPASFDSNGISHAARYGPWPSSVPSKFGLESPSASLNAAKDSRTSETLKLLHTSAFGSSELLSSPSIPVSSSLHDSGLAMTLTTGSSPPVNSGDEYFGKRTMHSSASAVRFPKPHMLSTSVPKPIDRDWETDFFLEEDYVPSSLANDVLTPQEKARRGSVRLTDEQVAGNGVGGAGAVDVSPSPSSLPKFGSPGAAASPSRWGPLFQRHREEEAAEASSGPGVPVKSMKHAGSAFGHVGSPLRNSSLAIDAELNNLTRTGNSMGGGGSSGSAPRSGSESLSVLTQQLQRTRIGEDSSGGSSPHLHPNAARSTSGNGPPSAAAMGGLSGVPTMGGRDRDRDRERGLERHVSSGSIGSSGRFTTPIDEEESSFVFSMEEEDETANQLRSRKRISGGLGGVGGWSYAGVAAATAGANRSLNGSGNKGREASNVVETVGGR